MHLQIRQVVSAALVVAAASLQASATILPSDPANLKSLDGTWRFLLEPAPHPKQADVNSAFVAPTLADGSKWHDITVPGNWDVQGFAPVTWNNDGDESFGLYRLEFTVPAEWKGRVVKINFDGVQNGAEVFLNGQPAKIDDPSYGRANYHQGGFTAFQVDLTPNVKFGEKNVLALRVAKKPIASNLDTGDFFFLAGIERSVTLFSVPQTHVDDVTVQTKVLDNDQAELRVLVDVAGGDAAAVTAHLDGFPSSDAKPGVDGNTEIVQTLDHPKLWSAEHPNLYTLDIDLKDAAGNVTQHLTRRVGVREVTIKDGVLLVNHVPVKLAGMCRHELYPTLGSALNEDVWRKDLTLMKAANVNAVRTSHYPYGEKFYDLCDELGIYVAGELSAGWTPTDTDAFTPAFIQHARELVVRDKNHPSVILWAVGNENKQGKNNKFAADELKRLDPTRPRLVSWLTGDQNGVELDDLHYTPPDKIAAANKEERRKTYPQIYLENPNNWEARNGTDIGSLDRWAAVIDRTWNVVWDADHVPGCFLWEWADRAVVDKNAEKRYDYFPATDIHLLKIKGIVDGYRNPRPAYYHVKVVYAPVKVKPDVVAASDAVTVHLTNHFSFTDVSELKTTWTLLNGDKEIASGITPISLAPRTSGDTKLTFDPSQLAQADTLRLNFDHADGLNIVTYDLHLKPATIKDAPTLDLTASASIKFPRLNLSTVTFPQNGKGWIYANRQFAYLKNATITSPNGVTKVDQATLQATPISAVQKLDADVIAQNGVPVGKVHADISDGHFSYSVQWTGATGDIQELGWIFAAPVGADHFSWHREAYWSYYPPTHIGRAIGTATPDSAKVDPSLWSRPDAFDFDSTKYDCDWATLAAADGGAGLGVVFATDDREHVRGNIAKGGYELVVNKQASPPRDLSSSVVPDYYLKLKAGDVVKGAFTIGTIPTHDRAASAAK